LDLVAVIADLGDIKDHGVDSPLDIPIRLVDVLASVGGCLEMHEIHIYIAGVVGIGDVSDRIIRLPGLETYCKRIAKVWWSRRSRPDPCDS
jgi:hypothetical protein